MPVRIVTFLVATWLMLAIVPVWAENQITIRGGGNSQININTSATNSSAIDIYQVGAALVNKVGTVISPVSQTGGNHTARIGQGATYAAGSWTPGTPVSNNSATISQSGVNGDTAAIYQTTSNNTASISQSESSQSATVTQSGSDFNTATLSQNGAAALQANIIQNGAVASTLIATQAAKADNAYTLTVTQGDTGGHAASLETTSGYNGAGLTVNQTGFKNSANVDGMSGGSASVNQTGSTNTADVAGMSGGSASISQSGTGGTVTLADQSSGALAISQQGTNNALSITNYGAGASSGQPLSVTQTGVTTYNPTTPPSGPTYSP
jgi:hypothetical protein